MVLLYRHFFNLPLIDKRSLCVLVVHFIFVKATVEWHSEVQQHSEFMITCLTKVSAIVPGCGDEFQVLPCFR